LHLQCGELFEVEHLGGNRSADQVLLHAQDTQVGGQTDLARERAFKLVAAEKEHLELGLENASGNGAVHQVVVVKVQLLQIRETSKLGRDGALELVVGPRKDCQSGESAHCGGNRALERVGVRLQELQIVQITETRRQRALQIWIVVQDSGVV
jgi:hypothetical protein